jgi:hypothetical protein
MRTIEATARGIGVCDCLVLIGRLGSDQITQAKPRMVSTVVTR